MGATIKKGDTRTSIVVDCFKPAGGAVDFTDATVTFVMMKGITALIDAPAYIVGEPTAGVLAYHFEDGQTDVTGDLLAWFKVTYPDGSRETFPNTDSIIVSIQ